MTSHLVLGIRLSPNSFQRIRINDVNLDDKSELLKIEASKTTNVPVQSLELVYCGNILDNEATLKSYGVKSGVMVHVLKKKDEEMPTPPKVMTEADIQQLVFAFRTFARHPSYRSALHRLSRPEVLENIILATPGLSDDPVATAIIQDAELLVHMENADTVRRISELHPALAEAANHIAAAVHEEATSGSSNPGTSSGYSYSLDALSEDDDDDEMESALPRGSGHRMQGPQSSITAAQLANALTSTGLFPAIPHASSSTQGGSSSSNIITSEMFSHAMQQAIANSAADSVAPPRAPETSDAGETERRLNRQVLQMRELGLTNNALNLQALRVTGGDMAAAIDLVFSGTFSPDAE